MYASIIFMFGSAFFICISWFSILNPLSHGFYRFIAWEAIWGLILLNIPVWTKDPLSTHQVFSWTALLISFFLALHAFQLLHSVGKPNEERNTPELFSLEKTSVLVTTGAYAYIRHPIYCALLFLTWGVFLKDCSSISLVLAIIASAALLLTALREEVECKLFFGQDYVDYIHKSKRFIPFIF